MATPSKSAFERAITAKPSKRSTSQTAFSLPKAESQPPQKQNQTSIHNTKKEPDQEIEDDNEYSSENEDARVKKSTYKSA